MVQYHAIALKEKRAGQKNGPSIKGGNRRALRDGVVESLVHALHFSIEGAAGAKDIGNGRTDRRLEFPGPLALGINATEYILFECLLLINALQLLWAGLGKLLGNAHCNARIFRGADANFLFEGN